MNAKIIHEREIFDCNFNAIHFISFFVIKIYLSYTKLKPLESEINFAEDPVPQSLLRDHLSHPKSLVLFFNCFEGPIHH